VVAAVVALDDSALNAGTGSALKQMTDLSPLVANVSLFDEPTIALGAVAIDRCGAGAEHRDVELAGVT
jgi:hypothetical protein